MAGFGAKVKLSADRSTAARQEFNDQINGLVKQIKISNKFVVLQKDMDRVRTSAQTMLNKSPIKITNIDCSQAVTKLRKDLQNVINSLSIKNGVSITGLVDPTGAGTIATQIDNIADAAARGQNEVNRFNAQMSVLKETMSSLATSYKSVLPGGKNAITDPTQLDALTQRYTALKQKIEEIRSANSIASQEQMAALQNEAVAIQNEIAQLNQERVAREQNAAAAKQAEKAKQDADTAAAQAQAEYRAQLDKVNSLLLQTKKNLDSWGASKVGKTSGEYAKIQEYIAELEALRSKLLLTGKATDDFGDRFGNLKTKINNSSAAIKEAGENTKTFTEHVGGLAAKFTSWLTISQVIMQVYRAMKEMVNVVAEVDAAMTELRKVTDETEATYSKFLDTAAVRAKAIGATISDTVNATADFARLGYSIADASVLADAAIVYKNVGDGIENISQASESIISTMQAFGIEATNVMAIVDKFNIIGNEFAISSTGIGEALLNSAAALAAAGNTLDESIALITAANEVIQNPEKVGTAMKTMSMYIRAAKTEAEEAGVATDGMANSVSELREEILALTGNKVDIMLDENTFKSTVQIIRELSTVWDDLTDISRTNITELIGGGVRNANVISALINNFETVEEVLVTSADAAGSALAENEKYLDSIAGKVSTFKATFEELSVTLINSESVKQIVDFGTGLLNVLNAVAKLIDSIGGLNTVLIGTAGIIAAIKLDSLIKLISVTLPAAFMKLIKPLTTVVTAIGRAPAVFKSFKSGTALAIPGTSRLSTALKALGISASAAQLAIGALTVVITAAIAIYQHHQQKLQEQRDAAIDAASSAETLSGEIVDLTNKYLELSEAVKTDATAKDDLLSTQDELIKKLDLEKGRIDELVEKYGNLTDAIKAASVESLQEAERDLRGGLEAQEDNLLDQSAPHDLPNWSMNHIITSWDKGDTEVNHEALNALVDAGYISRGSFGSRGMELYLPDDGYDLSTVEGAINAHKRLGEMLDIVEAEAGSNNEVWSALYAEYNRCTEAISSYTNSIDSLNSNLAQQYMLQGLIGKEVPKTRDEFDAYRQSIIDAAVESGEFIGTDQDIANAVNSILKGQTQFADFYANELVEAGDSVNYYKAQISTLTDVLSKLQSAYSALEAAEKDMADDRGLTSETIQALADAEENYLDFLYEENGVVMLNTEAWKENANAKMHREMVEIESEINSLAEQNRLLAEQNDILEDNIEYYNEQSQLGNDSDMWSQLISEATNAIENNNETLAQNSDLIRENQGLLAIYNSLYSDIAGNKTLDFSDMVSGLNEITNTIGSIVSAMEKLNEGTALTREELAKLALEYPDLLKESNLFTDGSIEGQKALLNTILSVRQAEYNALLDEKIAELKATEQVINEQLEMETDKANIIKELERISLNGIIGQEQEFVKYMNELNDLQGANYVALKEGELQVNDEALENKMKQEADSVVESTEGIWAPYGSAIISAHAQGYEGALNAADKYKAELAKKIYGIADASNRAFKESMLPDGSIDWSKYATSWQNYMDSAIGNATSKDDNPIDVPLNIQIVDENGNTISDVTQKFLDDWVSKQTEASEQRISQLEDYRQRVVNAYTNLESLRDNLDLVSIYGSAREDSSTTDSAVKSVEEYKAVIDEYYAAEKKLEEIQRRRADIERQISRTDDLSQRIRLTGQLVNAYNEEIAAERELAEAKKNTIEANVSALRALGFEVEYNRQTNNLYIRNLEHLNEITAKSVGEYESLQEATNSLRQDTEELINTTEDLNSENMDAASAIEDLMDEIINAKKDAIDSIEEIYNKQIESYQKIIDMKKEYIETTKEELDHEQDVADMVDEIAELQTRISLLSLDDSLSAQAERNALLEELAEKQKELANAQEDYSTDSQIEALDKLAENFEAQKKNEIEAMRNSVNSSEVLWNGFYQTLMGQTANLGSMINNQIASAWINAAQAVNSYSNAVNSLSHTGGSLLIGVGASSSPGYLPYSIPQYHDGGVVNNSNLGNDEVLALLKEGEYVLTEDNKLAMYKMIDFQSELADRLNSTVGSYNSGLLSNLKRLFDYNNQPISNSTSTSNAVFEPNINVTIYGNTGTTDSDAKKYGERVADAAIEKMYDAFNRRGISSTKGARLRPTNG